MGYFIYRFVDLTPEEVGTRRLAIDKHAQIAQLSQLAVLFCLIILKIGSRLITRWTTSDTESAPSSPQKKYLAEGRQRNFISILAKKWRIMIWKLDDEPISGYGTWSQWIGGLVWTIWLFILCARETAPDYMHITKRFGLIAASQLPLQYLLAMKSSYSPIQLLLRTSHETLNAAHQVLGRVVMLFLFLHASFYLNFFIRTGFWVNRFKDLDVILGLTGITLIALIGSSAMGMIRRWNYRLFFSIHAVAPIVLLSLIYFHAHHIRLYVIEALIIALANVGLRLWSSQSVPAEVTKIPDSSLIHMSLQSHASKRAWEAGNHVYLRRTGGPLSYFQANPFTISTLPNEDGKVDLYARVLLGNTRRLASMTATDSDVIKATPVALSLEGPYGHSTHLPPFEQFERILFVAGGVGATFILPLWRRCLQSKARASSDHQNIKLVWSVKQAQDATWAFDTQAPLRESGTTDERELYITITDMQESHTDTSMELSNIADRKDISLKCRKEGFSLHHGRPDLRLAVDEMLAGTSGQVAVFVCGPSGMGRAMRRHVGRWVMKGKDVYWHAEEFGL